MGVRFESANSGNDAGADISGGRVTAAPHVVETGSDETIPGDQAMVEKGEWLV